MSVFNTTEGVFHFLFDKTPRHTPLASPRARPNNPWTENGRARVAQVQAGPDVKDSIKEAISQLGDLSQVIKKGDKVLVKPNYNSPDPPPASTDLSFLKAVIQILLEAEAVVTVGESSGAIWRPTRNTLQRMGLYELGKELHVPVIAFEDQGNEWVKVPIKGDYLKSVTVPRIAYDADKMVYVPCMKTHRLAGHSGALKLSFGLVHPGERRAFHMGNLQQKLAEVNLWRLPDLIIMDGRKAFISGGPDRGEVVQPGLIMVSGDSVATDIEAIKVLIKSGAKSLPSDPRELPQIKTAIKHGMGEGFSG